MDETKTDSLVEIENPSRQLSPDANKRRLEHIIRIREANVENILSPLEFLFFHLFINCMSRPNNY